MHTVLRVSRFKQPPVACMSWRKQQGSKARHQVQPPPARVAYVGQVRGRSHWHWKPLYSSHVLQTEYCTVRSNLGASRLKGKVKHKVLKKHEETNYSKVCTTGIPSETTLQYHQAASRHRSGYSAVKGAKNKVKCHHQPPKSHAASHAGRWALLKNSGLKRSFLGTWPS